MSRQDDDQAAQDRFLAAIRQVGVYRDHRPSVRLYEAWKRDWLGQFPDATPEQYERAMGVLAQAAGV